jgi:hypothetical protein
MKGRILIQIWKLMMPKTSMRHQGMPNTMMRNLLDLLISNFVNALTNLVMSLPTPPVVSVNLESCWDFRKLCA